MKTAKNTFGTAVRILFFAGAVLIASQVFLLVRYPRAYGTEVLEACRKYDVNPQLVHAVIFAESGYHPNAKSAAGAEGLMQLMPKTAEYCASKLKIAYEEQRLTEPDYNINLGVYYLSSLLKRFSESDAVAAYNAGEGNVSAWIKQGLTEIPFQETREYVSRVLRAKKIYAYLGVKVDSKTD